MGNGDRPVCSNPPVLLRREPLASSAGRGDVGDCGDCSLSSKFPNADAPKNGWLSRPRIHDVGREGGRGSRGLKSSGCIDLAKLAEDAIDAVDALPAVANGGLDP